MEVFTVVSGAGELATKSVSVPGRSLFFQAEDGIRDFCLSRGRRKFERSCP